MRLIVLSLVLATILVAVPAIAADRIVDDKGVRCVSGLPLHHTISEAVEAASPGETILVCAGTYTDHVVVKTANLTLQAQGIVRVGPTGGGDYPHGFTIFAPGVTIRGFDISGYTTKSTCAIFADSPGGLDIRDNRVHDNDTGICVSGGSGSGHRVQYNVIEGIGGFGIEWYSAGGEISNNTLRKIGEYGIAVRDCDDGPVVHHNLVIGRGIELLQCAAVVTNNTVRSPGAQTPGNGIILVWAHGAVVTHNVVESMETGVLVWMTNDATVSSNTVSFNGVGLDLSGVDGTTVTRNYVTRSTIVDCRVFAVGTNTIVYNVCRTQDPAGAFD